MNRKVLASLLVLTLPALSSQRVNYCSLRTQIADQSKQEAQRMEQRCLNTCLTDLEERMTLTKDALLMDLKEGKYPGAYPKDFYSDLPKYELFVDETIEKKKLAQASCARDDRQIDNFDMKKCMQDIEKRFAALKDAKEKIKDLTADWSTSRQAQRLQELGFSPKMVCLIQRHELLGEVAEMLRGLSSVSQENLDRVLQLFATRVEPEKKAKESQLIKALCESYSNGKALVGFSNAIATHCTGK